MEHYTPLLPGALGTALPAARVRGVHLLPLQGHQGSPLPGRRQEGAEGAPEARKGHLRVRRGQGRPHYGPRRQGIKIRYLYLTLFLSIQFGEPYKSFIKVCLNVYLKDLKKSLNSKYLT